MGVDEAERRVLAREIDEDARQDRVLEHVGEIAGMKGVAIIHERQTRRNPDEPALRVHRTGATAIVLRWQVCRATLRQIA